MSYLGRQPVVGSFTKMDSIAGQQNGANNNFTLSVSGDPFSVESVFQFLVVKNGLVLEPGVGFSASGTTISFPIAPLITDNIWIIAYGFALYTGIPSDGTITNAKLADNTIDYNKLSGDAIGTIVAEALTFGI